MLELQGTKIIIDSRVSNFDIRELVPEQIYKAWGAQSIRFVQYNGVKWLQFSRDFFGAVHRVNNWHRNWQAEGRKFTMRGYRPPLAGFYNMLGDIYGQAVKKTIAKTLEDGGVDTTTMGLGSWVSIHKMGGAFDYTVDGLSADRVRDEILKHEKEFQNAGLTTIESGAFAPTWVHGDNRPTGMERILIVKPVKTRQQ